MHRIHLKLGAALVALALVVLALDASFGRLTAVALGSVLALATGFAIVRALGIATPHELEEEPRRENAQIRALRPRQVPQVRQIG